MKKRWIWLGAGGAAAAGALILFFSLFRTVDGRLYSLGAESLDFHGQPLQQVERLEKFRGLRTLDLRNTGVSREQLERLQQALPQCRILWQVEFQGEAWDPDIRELRVKELRSEDLPALEQFPELEKIRVEKVCSYQALQTLLQRDLDVEYRVELGGKTWPRTARNVFGRSEKIETLWERLPLLPELKRVRLLGDLPTMEEIRALELQFPEVSFSWNVAMGSLTAESNVEALTLASAELTDPEEFLALRAYFPELETVSLLESAFTNQEKLDLMAACPDLEFQWELAIGSFLVDGTREYAELRGPADYSLEDLRQALPLLPRLKKLVLLDSGFASEDLDRLDQDFPEVRIVWNVNLGGVDLRTDALYYAPNKYNNILCNDETIAEIRYCRDLVCVDVGHRQVTHCRWVRDLPHLKYLVVADTGIRDLTPIGDLKELVFLEAFLIQVKDYSPLKGCTALEDLNISYSHGEDPQPVIEMTWLKRLWWGGAPIPAYTLQQKMPGVRVECNAGSSTGKDWRQGQRYYEMRDLLGMKYMLG